MLSQGIAEGDITPMSDLTSCQQASVGLLSSPPTLAGLQEIAGTAQWRPPSVTKVARRHRCRLSWSCRRSPPSQVTRSIPDTLRLAFDDFSYPAYDASQACLPLTSKQWQERNIIGHGRGAGWRAKTQGEAGKVHCYNCRVFCTLLTGRESPWLTVLPSRL